MKQLMIFATQPQRCSYLRGELAVNVVVDPRATLGPGTYQQVIDLGFRRSGSTVYAPHCPNCRACVPVRVPVEAFRPNRSQRRNLRTNSQLEVRMQPARYTDEYFRLYACYLAARHPGGGMDDPTPSSLEEFLFTDWCETRFVEFRLRGRLLGVAVTDLLPNGLSAVYTFFDPAEGTRRGLGNYAVLWQIDEARRRGLPYLYLGYWIAECEKMRYKSQFQGAEGFVDGQWLPISGTERRTGTQ
jgi:arginine-tRNA-protein transferase